MFINTPCANQLLNSWRHRTGKLLWLGLFSVLVNLALASTFAHAIANPQVTPSFLKNYLSEPVSNGHGAFRWFGLKIYDAQLWTPAKASFNGDAAPNLANSVTNLFAQPFALRLTYARSLKGVRIAESSAEELARLQLGTAAQRAQWLQRMTALFPDVEENDAITGLYLPGVGAKFYFNQQPLGIIEDDAFARAFFAIWLDARTRAPDLRAALLNRAGRGN